MLEIIYSHIDHTLWYTECLWLCSLILDESCLKANSYRALSRRERIDDPLQNEIWAFGGWVPHFDKNLSDNVKKEITQFWHSSSRVSPNAKDMLKLRIGIRDYMPHPKNYLEVSQTILFKEFRKIHPRLLILQRAFESLKPFYCVPLKIWNTCCCKYHVEFSMHHELIHSIHSTLHSKEMLDNCGASGLPKSSRDLPDQFLSHGDDGCFFYRNHYLNEKCS